MTQWLVVDTWVLAIASNNTPPWPSEKWNTGSKNIVTTESIRCSVGKNANSSMTRFEPSETIHGYWQHWLILVEAGGGHILHTGASYFTGT
jgi:hypothetical protein